MDKPIKRSDLYVCWNAHGIHKYTLVAVVLGRTDTEVSYERYIYHGGIYDGNFMIPTGEFDSYYHPVNDIEYDVLKCLGYMQLEGGVQNGQLE